MDFQKRLSNGFILPEGKTTPNTLFVGGIDMKVEENEIREFFARFGAVKEVKIITYRGGICKGHLLTFQNPGKQSCLTGFWKVKRCLWNGEGVCCEDVDIQTIIEQQVTFKGRKLKLGPAIMKERSSRETGSIQSPIIGSSQWVSPSPYVYCTCCPPSLVTPNVLSGGAQYVQPYSYPGFQGVMIPQVPMNYAPTAYPYPGFVDCGVQTLLTLL
ncbi:deleted in azoospermia-like isoform X2 [Silurus asotus]|uniref:Deleted in azoospermia-like isoform X2 n=1 Tax=Silurus asotus TaxID=30991 RepID=A0AAD5B9G2_SILAS|nr:deleted in azoospermia-like isoform X2 [Silurus asotus]